MQDKCLILLHHDLHVGLLVASSGSHRFGELISAPCLSFMTTYRQKQFKVRKILFAHTVKAYKVHHGKDNVLAEAEDGSSEVIDEDENWYRVSFLFVLSSTV